MEITLADRHKAKRILEDLHRDYEMRHIAKLFGVPAYYATCAKNLLISKSGYYITPKWAIAKINEYGKMLGSRRISP